MNRHNDKEIKDLVSNFIDAFQLRPQFTAYQIRQFWAKEMSPMVNRYTSDIKVRGKKLFIYVSSAPVKHDLFIQREQIKKLINDQLETPFIEEVIIS